MIPIEEILAQEIKDREALAPDHYSRAKKSSVDHALALGIAPAIVARLYGAKHS